MALKIKIAPNDSQSMSQDGEAILRSLQNKSLPVMDLLVRESLQNSLDATLEDSLVTKVDFLLNTFESEQLASHFEDIDRTLRRKYSGEQKFLSVSDKNTTGLTGDYRSDRASDLDKSNFHKLVFGIGKNQEADGSGGSWGLGKTSYFRIGAGIVIYYTRILIENKYEERLIASLIENPKQKERLLPKSERGIAWWGEYDQSGKKILPITKGNEIEEILNIFGIKRYSGLETGTTIIIPYLNSLENDHHNDDEMIFPWETESVASIRMAIQRWYSPRMMNEQYNKVLNNSMLDCNVNGIGFLKGFNTEPIFDIFNELYTVALTGVSNRKNILVKPIFLQRNALQNAVNIPVGYVAFSEVGREELKMTPPDNKHSGLAYLGIKDKRKIESNYSKVLAYARKPGMIVEYAVDGDWMPKGAIHKEDSLLLGFFVPNSNALLLEKFNKNGYFTLENYLRATENADHANWVDEDGIGIIRRMKQYTVKAISDSYQNQSNDQQTSATSALSRKYGQMLLPPKNFGRTSARQKSDEGNKKTVNNRNRISDIRIISSMPLQENVVEVKFKAFIKKKSTNMVFLQVLSQDKNMDKSSWDKSMGNTMEFPFAIDNIFIDIINGESFDKTLDQSDNEFIKLDFDKTKSNEFGITSKISSEIEIEGIIHLNVQSSLFIPNIAIRSEVNEGVGE